MTELRMTVPTQLVLSVLLEDPTQERYGLDISNAAGLARGTVHPILARLEGMGWVESRWEEVDVLVVGRPARRYYRLTGTGAESSHAALARARRPALSRLQHRPGWEG
jgi:DNA-binding PadR family transcriptional regulator